MSSLSLPFAVSLSVRLFRLNNIQERKGTWLPVEQVSSKSPANPSKLLVRWFYELVSIDIRVTTDSLIKKYSPFVVVRKFVCFISRYCHNIVALARIQYR